jgi:hypothetical protein
MNTDNEDVYHTLVHYLQVINTADSRNLLKSMTSPQKDGYSNSTRSRRGSNWDEYNSVYNLIASQSSRRADESRYPYHKAYIWGKQFGVPKANIQIAAGGFIGVSALGDYKVFGRAKAVGHAFGKTKTAVDVLVLREKTSTSASTKLFVEIVGKVLISVNENSKFTECHSYSRSLYERRYTLFDFGIPIFVYVATIRFYLAGHIRLSSDLDLEFCKKSNSVTAAAGLVTTLTMELEAGASANLLLLARGGISVTGVFNYQLTPELSTKACFINHIRVRNCIGIYHQWVSNRIELEVWYQLRKVKWCRTRWGKIPYPCGIDWGDRKSWDALSKTWYLGGSSRKALWEQCGSDFVCSPYTAAAMLLAPSAQKTASVDFEPNQPLPDEPQTPSLRGPPLVELPADDLID